MKRKFGPHCEVTRRSFLSGLVVAAGGTLAPEALSQALAAVLPESHRFSVAGAEVEFVLTRVSEATLRISIMARGGGLEPRTAFAGVGLVDRVWPAPMAVMDEDSRASTVLWDGRRIVARANPLTLSVLGNDGVEIQRLGFDAATGKVSFALQDSPVFGLGEGGHQFDRRGVVDAMRNGQFKPDQFLNGGRSPIPWLISPRGWALFFHHPMGTFDLTGRDGVFRPAEPAQPQDIFLCVSNEPAVLLREFAQLTGLPHLAPIWSLGYQQSHRTLASREEVLEEAKTFRQKKLPCDVMIYLGTGFAPSGWNTGHGSFAFNEKIFPDPAAMFREMHDEGFRAVLHVLGAPHDLHGRVADRSPDPDDAANYWADHLKTFRSGIDGWWVDDGDELPPEARLARNEMYWEGPLEQRPNVRPFSIQRNGYAGLQRYGFLWSGDTNSSWQTLRVQIADGLNTGLSGIPYWGTDTGGFFSTKELTAELYVRWFQFSAFCPLFRSHGRTWKLRLPWGWNQGDVGPVEDDPKLLPTPDQLHNTDVEVICRKYLDLRYRLLPYVYSMVYQTHRTGLPLMRALWLAFPGDAKALAVDDAYLWGDALLVAPVTQAAATQRSVYLPAGAWYDYWTQARIQGGTETVAASVLSTLPLFVKAGSILPMGPVRQYTTERSLLPLDLYIYPGVDGRFSLYEDDGVSMDHTRGMFSLIRLEWTDSTRTLLIRLADGVRMHTFTTRAFVIHVAGESTTKSVTFDGAAASHTL
jgi:alpha-glucosidase (family GH31 glycosyl hydrolase)